MFFEKKDSLFVGRFSVWFESPVVFHGFSTRKGGVSAVPYDSLNLGLNTEDDPEAVAENVRRFCNAIGVERGSLAFTKQIHDVQIEFVQKSGIYPDTDALVTNLPRLGLVIQVADCTPVFLYDPVRHAAGLAHAGWKGSAAGIAAKTVRSMIELFKTRPEDVQACIGPSIGPCCYEVEPEVAGQFPIQYISGNKLDLWRFNYDLLKRTGLRPGSVTVSRLCTRCHSDWFFSHRASGGTTGRMMALFGLRERT